MAGAPQSDDGITGINVTPLVDIMLVLLIIFMVTAGQIVNPSIEVDLPKAASAGEGGESPLAVVLTADGTLHMGDAPVTEAELAARCRALAAANPKAQAIIAADGQTSHAAVIRVIDLVKLNGVTRFALNVDRPSEG